MEMPVSGVSEVTPSRSVKLLARRFLNSSLVVVALIVLVVIFTIATPHFLTARNLFNILQAVAVVGILTVGQVFVIITAGIDISQGSIVGLVGVVSALMMTHGVSVWLSILAGLAVGAVVGIVNGLLVAVAGIQPFISTLGTMSVASGAALIVTNGQPVFGIPASVSNFGSNGIFSIFPDTAITMIILAVWAHLFLSKTKYGRYTYAVGSNPLSARLSGLRVRRQLMWVYVVSGVASAIGGIIMVAWVDSALPTAGTNYELNSIAAVVIGGASLFGGEGTVLGSMIGALLMAVLSNGAQLLGISSYWQNVLLGMVVLAAVYIDRLRRRSVVK
ncbi:MAG: ABC transporter permease [Alicyclobacillus sp.]|nr:ABC transporter permease [Alicyclobacillus sp.]